MEKVVNVREVNEAGISLIKEFEGFEPSPYRCPAGYWTIGYGHKINPGETFKHPISEDEAITILHQDLLPARKSIEQSVKVKLTDNQFAALASFVYNVGQGNFYKSTLLRKLNEGDYECVPSELEKWKYAGGNMLGGLLRRRVKEGQLWRS